MKINTYFLYFLFFLAGASWVEDAFTNNINEIVWGWDAVAYMQRQAQRYARRRHFWALSAPAADERLHPWERLDRVLMTNQLWLLLMLYGAGGAVVVLGYMLMLHQGYNMWTDPLLLAMLYGYRLFYWVVMKVCVRIFRKAVKPVRQPGARGTWRV